MCLCSPKFFHYKLLNLLLRFRINVTFVTRGNEKITVQGKVGESFLDVAVNNDVDLEGFGQFLLSSLIFLVVSCYCMVYAPKPGYYHWYRLIACQYLVSLDDYYSSNN